jgi:zinc protease
VAEATLDNGLRVLVLEDHRSPVVSVQVWYRVGSRNERPGATGLAHFLEHMMFKGTPSRGKGEFARLVEQNGGQDNAFTTQDVTSYYVDIAADKVEMVLGLEADRMRHLLLDAKEIDSERLVAGDVRSSEILAAARRLFGASQKVADFLIGIEEQGLGLDYPERFKAGIAKVTAADVQRAAAQYLDPATFSSVIVGK